MMLNDDRNEDATRDGRITRREPVKTRNGKSSRDNMRWTATSICHRFNDDRRDIQQQ